MESFGAFLLILLALVLIFYVLPALFFAGSPAPTYCRICQHKGGHSTQDHLRMTPSEPFVEDPSDGGRQSIDP